jgi:hypothetical protein
MVNSDDFERLVEELSWAKQVLKARLAEARGIGIDLKEISKLLIHNPTALVFNM